MNFEIFVFLMNEFSKYFVIFLECLSFNDTPIWSPMGKISFFAFASPKNQEQKFWQNKYIHAVVHIPIYVVVKFGVIWWLFVKTGPISVKKSEKLKIYVFCFRSSYLLYFSIKA